MTKMQIATTLMIAIAATTSIGVRAETPATILRTLPKDVQENIEGIRTACREAFGQDGRITAGDEGLKTFSLSGAQGVLVDDLNFCADGQCIHGINCATGFSHSVAIYIRYGSTWKKSFSVDATEPIFLSVERTPDLFGKFRALVVSVGGGDEVLGCPIRNKNNPQAWKHEKCDFLVKWDGNRFSHKPL